MHSALVNVILWIGYLFLVLTLWFLFRGKSYRVLRLFSAYVAVFVVRDFAWLIISNNHAMFNSLWAYYGFWSTEFLLSWLRAFAIVEICWRTLRTYSAVWPLTACLLGVISISLLIWTAISAKANRGTFQRFIDIGLQRIELMQAMLIVAFFVMVSRYQVRVLPIHRLVMLGFGVYSAVQVFNNELGWLEPHRFLRVFDIIRRASINVSELIWLYAAALPASKSMPPPSDHSGKGTVDELAPQIHDRLRELNDRLGELLQA